MDLTIQRDDDDMDGEGVVDFAEGEGKPWWYSLEYRPILGVVPLEGSRSTEKEGGLEVVVVERPL